MDWGNNMIFNISLVKDKTKKNRERILQKRIKKYQRELTSFIKSAMREGETWIGFSIQKADNLAFDAIKHILHKLHNVGYVINGKVNGTYYYECSDMLTLKTEDRKYTIDIKISWSEKEN